MIIYSRDDLGHLVDPRMKVADVIADLHARLKTAEATRDACQAANTALTSENRELNRRVDELTRLCEASLVTPAAAPAPTYMTAAEARASLSTIGRIFVYYSVGCETPGTWVAGIVAGVDYTVETGGDGRLRGVAGYGPSEEEAILDLWRTAVRCGTDGRYLVAYPTSRSLRTQWTWDGRRWVQFGPEKL